jgi:hypothetical protein
MAVNRSGPQNLPTGCKPLSKRVFRGCSDQIMMLHGAPMQFMARVKPGEVWPSRTGSDFLSAE